MSALELARWQFAITTLFHYIFVPLSIGLAFHVAVIQTRWHRSGHPEDLRAVRFWGKFMLITFAVGVVTGIWQEFQFGMSWSAYSRYVGDIFGAPLAIEGLAAFFLEATFVGLWLFGWGRLRPGVHLATIWCVCIGTILSAAFILVANSWMQNPVGYTLRNGRAELTDFFALFTNSVFLHAFPHTILAAVATSAAVIAAISAWHLARGNERVLFGRSLRVALVTLTIGTLGAAVVGDSFGRLLISKQPMKMAAGEALFHTEKPAAFSVFATGAWEANPGETNRNLKIPHALSLLSTLSWDGAVPGIAETQAAYERRYGPGNYVPVVGLTYWSWRAMIYSAGVFALVGVLGLLLWWRKALEDRRFLKLCQVAVVFPFLSNFGGWVFTEAGRQPWAIQGLLKTSDAVSPNVSATKVWISLVGLSLLYAVLLGVALWLFRREGREGPHPEEPEGGAIAASQHGAETRDLELAY